jgi:hypothetical protein
MISNSAKLGKALWRRVSAAVLLALGLAPSAATADVPIIDQVAQIRARLLESRQRLDTPPVQQPQESDPDRVAQWLNWPNFWNNWGNWGNWNNWNNWGNWRNW